MVAYDAPAGAVPERTGETPGEVGMADGDGVRDLISSRVACACQRNATQANGIR